MADTQWKANLDAENPVQWRRYHQPAQYRVHQPWCQFVIQVGDLVDVETDALTATLPAQYARSATSAQALYDAEIGFTRCVAIMVLDRCAGVPGLYPQV
jgi:hypothetical protein